MKTVNLSEALIIISIWKNDTDHNYSTYCILQNYISAKVSVDYSRILHNNKKKKKATRYFLVQVHVASFDQLHCNPRSLKPGYKKQQLPGHALICLFRFSFLFGSEGIHAD